MFLMKVITKKGIHNMYAVKNKALSIIFAAGILAFSIAGCSGPNNSPLFGGNDLNLQGLMVTEILIDRTAVSSALKWSPVSGADHYELSRKQNGGNEVNIGPSKISKDVTSYSDLNLQENSSYKYIVRAIDSNNKVIMAQKGETEDIKPITSTDLQASDIQGLSFPPELNKITRDATLKWSSVVNSDLYYASIINVSSSKQIFGVFTKETSVNINLASSPINPPDIIKQKLPILTGGLEKAVQHSFSVYTIKFNNAELEKATAIGLRQSKEVSLIL
jgi:hypothetical protein